MTDGMQTKSVERCSILKPYTAEQFIVAVDNLFAESRDRQRATALSASRAKNKQPKDQPKIRAACRSLMER
jgi:hypothetical protein